MEANMEVNTGASMGASVVANVRANMDMGMDVEAKWRSGRSESGFLLQVPYRLALFLTRSHCL